MNAVSQYQGRKCVWEEATDSGKYIQAREVVFKNQGLKGKKIWNDICQWVGKCKSRIKTAGI